MNWVNCKKKEKYLRLKTQVPSHSFSHGEDQYSLGWFHIQCGGRYETRDPGSRAVMVRSWAHLTDSQLSSLHICTNSDTSSASPSLPKEEEDRG